MKNFNIEKNRTTEFKLDKNTTNLIKFLACLLIAFAHYSGYAIVNGLEPLFIYKFIAAFGGYVGVALFFFFSGYGLMKSEQRKDAIKFAGFLTKRLRRTYLPAVLVSALWLGIAYFVDLDLLCNKNYISGVFLSFNDEVMWFVSVILIMYLFFFTYRYISLKNVFKKTIFKVVLLSITTLVGYCFIRYLFDAYCASNVPFFFIGIVVAEFNRYFKLFISSFIVVILLVLLLGAVMYLYRADNFVLHGCINYLVVTFMLFIFSNYNIQINMLPHWIGDCSYDVYLVHYKVHLLNISLFSVNTIWMFIVCTVVSTFLFNIIRKLFRV